MADQNGAKASQTLRVSSVGLHRRGETETGTLHLSRHHLIFSYYLKDQESLGTTPKAPVKDASSLSEASASSRQSSGLADSSVLGGSSAEGTKQTGDDMVSVATVTKESPRASKPRLRSREKQVFVPYPLINYCMLRPCPAQGSTASRTIPREATSRVSESDADDLFPPTYGTSPYARASTDSARLAPYSSPKRTHSPASNIEAQTSTHGSGRPPAIRLRCKDFTFFALHFHQGNAEETADETARQVFQVLRNRCCHTKLEDLYAFHYQPAPQEAAVAGLGPYEAHREFSRMGIGGKAADGPGAAWRISEINSDYSFSPTYPSLICVPRAVSDNMLKYGGSFRSRSRIPALSYLHSNGGSITRSSQPLTGVQSKRSPQDERLVTAIFSSHTPPLSGDISPPLSSALTSSSSSTLASSSSDATATQMEASGLSTSQSETALEETSEAAAALPRRRVYGSTRKNLIVDARPRLNTMINKAAGGGIEDISNYVGTGEVPVEKLYLNIANIHVMRSSLEKVVDSFKNSDYLDMPPDQEALRKSNWLGHIAGLLDGAETVARTVGLGGSHVLVHCSDGWDRTAQISSLAQVMLDPYYRTIEGIIRLIQKDWLSFGHKFHDRNGIIGCEKWFEIENERLTPARNVEGGKPNTFEKISSQALSGARGWFDKSRGSLFRQQNTSQDNLSTDGASDSRPPSPPPNPLLHSSPAASTTKQSKKHKVDEKEMSPIFHQLLDALYQLKYQNPNAFEFDERFLLRLFYHAYAGQYGEFLFNNETERSMQAGKTQSVWTYFLGSKAGFTNPDYIARPGDLLLFPQRLGVEKEAEVRWWSKLFSRKDEEMNLAIPISAPIVSTSQYSFTLFSDDGAVSGAEKAEQNSPINGSIRGAKSAPSLTMVRDSLSTSLSSLGMRASVAKAASESTSAPSMPPIVNQDIDRNVLDMDAAQTGGLASASGMKNTEMELAETPNIQVETIPTENVGAPETISEKGGLDFAGFAQGSAFSER